MDVFLQKLGNMKPAYRAHVAGLFFVVTSIVSAIAFPEFKNTHQALQFFGSLAFAIGFSIWCWPMLKKVWEHPVGRMLIFIPHLFVLLLSTVVARNIVASALGLPPQDFDLSVSFIALLFYVPAWSLVVSILIGIFASILYLTGFLVRILNHPTKETVKLFGHAAGAFAICVYSSAVFNFSIKNETTLHSMVRWLALLADFQNAKTYPGIAATERIRLHENGVISVATIENNTVVIRIRKHDQ